MQVFYLGQFELRYQIGQRREKLRKPPTQKSQSLLAYLAYHRRRPQPRERLMAMFWGDRPDHRARRSLSTALWHIRRCFPNEDPVRGNVRAVRFEFPGTVELDVEAFARQARDDDPAALQAAIASYRGAFLPGFYDDWVIDERYRLQSLFEEALARLMVLAESHGRHEMALQTAQRLLEADALREDAHRLLMRVYARLGRRNAALAQYQRCRETIVDELGVEPMAETTELYRSIAGGHFEAMSLAEDTATTVLPVSLPPLSGQNPLDPIVPDVLAGREAEMDFLLARWREAPAASVTLILVSGEAGVGKTHLLKSFAAQLHQEGAAVLWGRCYEFERLLPYQPVAEALRPLLANMSREDLRRLPAWVSGGLSHLLPELLDERETADEHEAGRKSAVAAAAEDQPRLFHAVTHFLDLVATSAPLLIVVDDVHWASASTLALLHYLARHVRQQPLLLVGAYRQEAVGIQHPLRAWRQTLRRDGLARQLRLGRLPTAAVESWLVEMAGADEGVRPLARRLHAETEGNPFFVVQMVKALFEMGAVTVVDSVWQVNFEQISGDALPLPATIRELIDSRVKRLPPDVQEVLSLAAVLGQEFDFDVLETVWEQGQEATLAALEALLRARLVEEGAGATERDYVFTHHKIREVIYEAIPRRRRQQRHAQTARTMVTLHAGDLDAWLGEVAFHFEQGQKIRKELTGEAVDYLRRAGEQAVQHFANAEAVSYFSRALALLPDKDRAGRYALLLAREAVYDTKGERKAQAQDLAALQELAQVLSSEQRAEVALRQANYAEVTGDYPAAISAAEAAIPLAQAAQSPSLEAFCCLPLGRALWRQGNYDAARRRFEQALTLARSAKVSRLEAEALRNIGNVAIDQSDFAGAVSCLEQALSIFGKMGDREGEAYVLNGLGLLAANRGDFATARVHYEKTLSINRETGNRQGEGLALLNLGYVSYLRQDFVTARDRLEQALPICRAIGDRRTEGLALLDLGYVTLHRAKYTAAIAYVKDGLRICREIGDRQKEGWGLSVLGYVFETLGKYREAQEYFERALQMCRELGERWVEGWRLTDLGLLSHHVGDDVAARDYSRKALQIARDLDDRPVQVYALTTLGHVLAELGQPAQAVDAYREAIDLSNKFEPPPEQWT